MAIGLFFARKCVLPIFFFQLFAFKSRGVTYEMFVLENFGFILYAIQKQDIAILSKTIEACTEEMELHKENLLQKSLELEASYCVCVCVCVCVPLLLFCAFRCRKWYLIAIHEIIFLIFSIFLFSVLKCMGYTLPNFDENGQAARPSQSSGAALSDDSMKNVNDGTNEAPLLKGVALICGYLIC